ncbi:hypothetical protein MC378_07685 [Polaribacter sp. MSW13]|uniref:Uncharacterized protein n=1 Tax=Polaribacter marinus TaxID=2916838 RepID=A0A9X1VQU4_9FLAO|nr:DUF6686 family protein [Polaribacter marinus]MCI2229045.1 hypothetical protein [Polaribacter marinus]
MCYKTKIISRVKSGELSVCNGCKIYSLTFNNVFFQFEADELNQFKQYILNLDIEYWLDHYSVTTRKRKIPVPTFHQNLILIFDIYEMEELKVLLGINDSVKKVVLSPQDVDYTLILN